MHEWVVDDMAAATLPLGGSVVQVGGKQRQRGGRVRSNYRGGGNHQSRKRHHQGRWSELCSEQQWHRITQLLLLHRGGSGCCISFCRNGC